MLIEIKYNSTNIVFKIVKEPKEIKFSSFYLLHK